ncbi:carboxymuconolactone decarboxylase family protein [Microlunatus speluncae]|uniref:carboxymuconolactone decarboxylase family protein n=1 Tax=Microlunatus speluncae TaxID=2594267 RepID=UPI0012662FBE|nr:carboxymuconolactone decarboxylase family protein [Microlunatus speluncae]
MFADHTTETAPEAARRSMAATEKHLGYLPAAVARFATAPQLLNGFLQLSGMFEATSLDPLARETLIMTMATRNRCHLCVAMHTAKLVQLGADPALVTALRTDEPLPDGRLAALREFTITVLETAGDVPDEALDAFVAAGFTAQQALEVVLGIGAYTMSTLANRLTKAPVDDSLAAHAWTPAG